MTPLSLTDEQITRAIERRIDDYHHKFLSPSPATITKWRRQEARKLDRKNQLSLPLVFPDDPHQMSLFEQGE
jgi:hypothetical protein